MKTVIHGILKENPIFVLLLGLCPALAVTTTVESAITMGLCVFVILLFSNTIISIFKNFIPQSVQIPTYIIIIGTFVTIVELLLKYFVPQLHSVLGIYLPLIVVNCIVLGRALAVASKEKVTTSIKDAIGIGLGFCFALILLSLFREVLGNNTLTLMDGLSPITGFRMVYRIFPTNYLIPFSILKEPAGAFLALALFVAIWTHFKKEVKHESN